MSTSATLFGDSVRDAAKPWLEELGKSDKDRLQKLLNLAITEKIRLSEVLARLFPGEDTQTALANLTRLRNRLNEVGVPLGLSCKVDTKKKSPPEERALWFTGPDEAVLRATRFSQQMTADVEGKPFIPTKGIATTGSAMAGNKRVVRFFISYAHENKTLAEALVKVLRSQFKASKSYELEFWMDREIMVGEKWNDRILTAIAECHFGLFMLSPDFLGSGYIGENEIPPFVSGEKCKPVVPIGLVPVSFARHDLKGLEENQIFFLRGRTFDQMRLTAEKTEFARHLHEEMEKRLDAYFAGPSENAVGTPDHCEDEETCQVQAGVRAVPDDLQRFMPPLEETRHFQRTRGHMHHLSQRESIDPAKASLGEARDALDELEAWVMRADGSPFFALLGEVGIGKTTTLKQFTRQLIEKRGREPGRYPLPVYIDLRDYVGDSPGAVPTIEELLTSVIQRSWRVTDRSVTAGDLLRLVREEGALIIFDGLDEKIVHLTQSRARDFIRTLWSVLPQAMLSKKDDGKEAPAAGKMLLSCRSHYFRDVWSQNAMLTGEDREGLDRSQYPAFCLLPFDEAQIRGYLVSFLGDAKRGGEAFDLIASIHNLRDLAERPYLLSLISGRLGELEVLQMRGETVNAARLYDLVVRSWLSRDDGKHHLDAMHKRRLMEALAAALWRSGEKQWDVDRLEEWFDEFLHQNPAIASAYASKDRALLKEDLRTATFVLRPDTEEKHFRFAHTSLQEYFLACHLARALIDKIEAAWDMPMVSRETLAFLGQILSIGPAGPALQFLERLLGGDCLTSALVAFRYWLIAIELKTPEPRPTHVNLSGAKLEEQTIKGHSKENPLNLRGANLQGLQLNRSRLQFVDAEGANLNGLEGRQALFIHVSASKARLIDADLAGLQWREGSLDGAHVKGTNLELATIYNVSLAGLWLPPSPRGVHSMCKVGIYIGHLSAINDCSWNSNGTAFVSASNDGTLKIWDGVSGQELMCLRGHRYDATCCVWSHDNRHILSGSSDGTLKVWDAVSGGELRSLNAHDGLIDCCDWSRDGRYLLAGGSDQNLTVWDAISGREITPLKPHGSRISCCKWSPDGLSLASGAKDGTLKVWDANSGRALITLEGHTAAVTCCAWHPNSRYLLSGDEDGVLKLWDSEGGKQLVSLKGHSYYVRCCGWSPDGCRAFSGGRDEVLKIWDATRWQELTNLTGHTWFVSCCSWSPDGKFLLSGGGDQILKIWNANSGEELMDLGGHRNAFTSCSWSPDSSLILTGSWDGTITVHEVSNGKKLANLDWHAEAVFCQAWSPDGAQLFSADAEGKLMIWDGTNYESVTTIAADGKYVSCCVWSPTGDRLLSGGGDQIVQIWDAKTGQNIMSLVGHSSSIECCAWNPDGSRVLSGGGDKLLKLWDAVTGKELMSLAAHEGTVKCCNWSPDGTRLLSGADDADLKVWDATTGAVLQNLSAHGDTICSCAWSPDGKRILSGSADSTIKIWDAVTGTELLSLEGHYEDVICCVWSPNGARLISASNDNTLKLWDAHTGKCLWTAHNLPEHQSAVISGDGTGILHATQEAWRWVGWEERDAKGRFIRRLPAEVFGPIPGMED